MRSSSAVGGCRILAERLNARITQLSAAEQQAVQRAAEVQAAAAKAEAVGHLCIRCGGAAADDGGVAEQEQLERLYIEESHEQQQLCLSLNVTARSSTASHVRSGGEQLAPQLAGGGVDAWTQWLPAGGGAARGRSIVPAAAVKQQLADAVQHQAATAELQASLRDGLTQLRLGDVFC